MSAPATPLSQASHETALRTGDPRPQPPVQPSLEDCCLSGCNPCVFDLYEQALERYELALAAWKARNNA